MVSSNVGTTPAQAALFDKAEAQRKAKSTGLRTSFEQLLSAARTPASDNSTRTPVAATKISIGTGSQNPDRRQVSAAAAKLPAPSTAARVAVEVPVVETNVAAKAAVSPAAPMAGVATLTADPNAAAMMPMTRALDLRPPDLGRATNKHGLDAATGLPRLTSADKYWDAQPEAVQALRDIKDPDERGRAALNLATQGYQIDVPIMVWNWDPETTMTVRHNMGYSWVPSGLQAPVAAAPGVSFPSLPSYDPNSGPQGSIAVNIDFTQGVTGQNAWMRFGS